MKKSLWLVFFLLCIFTCYSAQVLSASSSVLVFWTGDTKSEETANKEAGEEKPEEDNDYHRSDEQVRVSYSHNLLFKFSVWFGFHVFRCSLQVQWG